jgi:hypothetical protein
LFDDANAYSGSPATEAAASRRCDEEMLYADPVPNLRDL